MEVIRDLYRNGNILREYIKINWKKEGIEKTYYPNGNLESDYKYFEGSVTEYVCTRCPWDINIEGLRRIMDE